MNKIVIIFLVALITTGCSRSEIGSTSKPLKGGENNNWEVLCIDGVEYIFRAAGYSAVMSVKMNSDSTVSECSIK